MHGVVENEREKRVKLVWRGVPVATSRVSEHGDAFKLALVTADIEKKERELASKLKAGYILRSKSKLSYIAHSYMYGRYCLKKST